MEPGQPGWCGLEPLGPGHLGECQELGLWTLSLVIILILSVVIFILFSFNI